MWFVDKYDLIPLKGLRKVRFIKSFFFIDLSARGTYVGILCSTIKSHKT